jgi:hypothetical protein
MLGLVALKALPLRTKISVSSALFSHSSNVRFPWPERLRRFVNEVTQYMTLGGCTMAGCLHA